MVGDEVLGGAIVLVVGNSNSRRRYPASGRVKEYPIISYPYTQ